MDIACLPRMREPFGEPSSRFRKSIRRVNHGLTETSCRSFNLFQFTKSLPVAGPRGREAAPECGVQRRLRFHVGNSPSCRQAGAHLLANLMLLTQNLSLG